MISKHLQLYLTVSEAYFLLVMTYLNIKQLNFFSILSRVLDKNASLDFNIYAHIEWKIDEPKGKTNLKGTGSTTS